MKEFKPSKKEVCEILDRWYDLEEKRRQKEQKRNKAEAVSREDKFETLRDVASMAIVTSNAPTTEVPVLPVVEPDEQYDTKLINVFEEIRK